MKYKNITTIASILTFINAFFFLLFPDLSLFLLGRTTNLTGLMNTRISGACALGLSALTWSSRNTKSNEVQRVVYIGNLTAFGILIVVDFHGVMLSAINELGWLIFFVDLLIFLGFLSSAIKNRGS
jgi:hypothetical protein